MKMFRKILGAVLAMTMTVTSMAAMSGCSNSSSTSSEASTESANSDAENNNADTGDKLKIGIIQYGSHPSLDNCYEGIIEGLNASSYADKIEIDTQNGSFDSATCDTIAKSMVASDYDMIFAIATPAALSAYSAAQNSDTPVIFCAVSDPVAAGLTASFDAGNENCVGTSDVLELDKQVELIKTLQPDVKSIGVLYTTTEANSLSQLATLKEICSEQGIEVVEQGVSTAADIPQAATTIASQVDCINNFTDNNVVNNLSVLLEKANAAGVPVYGSEVEQVKNGCLASISIDYVALGVKTAEMGVEVLDGAKCSEMAVGKISEGTPVVNTEVLAQFGIELPESLADAEQVVTNSETAEAE
jgi:putative ABC transport system substrate-binding protein